MTSETSLYAGLQDLSGARFSEANHAGDTIDNDLLRAAQERGEALPTAGDPDRDKYHGAVVFDPEPGLHRNVCYPDYSSLYPNIIRDCNMSPETIVGVGARTLMRSDYSRDELRWSYIDPRPVKQLSDGEMYRDFTDGEYKMVYDPSSGSIKWRDDWSRVQQHLEPIYFLPPSEREGTLASRTDDYIRWNKSYSGTMYSATKRVRNAVYGVSGDNNFRLFDWRVAEAVTIAGRLLLEYGADTLTERLQSEFPSDAVYVTHGDTDGFGIAVDLDVPQSHVLPQVRETTEWLNEVGMPRFVEDNFGVPAQQTAHEVEVESYAPRLFIPEDDSGGGTKKTYAQRITWDDGDDCDSIDVKGFDCKRSDVADITESVQKQVLEWILTEGRQRAKELTYERIRAVVDAIESGTMPLERIGERSGLSKDPEEYGAPNRSAHPIYRGSKYAKAHIDGEESFSKPMKFPVRRIEDPYPRVYDTDTGEDGTRVDYIAVEDVDNIPEEIHVDRKQVVQSVLKQPLQSILRTMDWSWDEAIHGHEQQTFNAFSTA